MNMNISRVFETEVKFSVFKYNDIKIYLGCFCIFNPNKTYYMHSDDFIEKIINPLDPNKIDNFINSYELQKEYKKIYEYTFEKLKIPLIVYNEKEIEYIKKIPYLEILTNEDLMYSLIDKYNNYINMCVSKLINIHILYDFINIKNIPEDIVLIIVKFI
jgi:hypothetical protein